MESFKLLQPGLMSTKEISGHLRNIGFEPAKLASCSKNELEDLYTSNVMPLPQRSCRKSRYGRISTNKLKRKRGNELSPNISSPDDANSKLKKTGGSPNKGQTITLNRLKPPLEHSEVSNKKIKLSRTSTDSTLDKLIINKRTEETSMDVDEQDSSGSKRSNLSDQKKADGELPMKKARQKISWP